MQDMIEKLFHSIKKLREVIDKRYEISEKRAVAEYNYREMLGREMAAAKVDGMVKLETTLDALKKYFERV